jgi:SAM-dependent methyltransferase
MTSASGSDDKSVPLTREELGRRSSSFGGIAGHYARYRQGPPSDAVDWVLEALDPRIGHPERVVDLGAGTGGLTRELVGRAVEVVAVEPDDRMREVLAGALPAVRALAGRGEDIPLPDGSAQAVLASASWHWMEVAPTLREVGRVLVPGGVLGAMWSGPDPESPFLAEGMAALAGGEAGGLGEQAAVELDRAVNDPATAQVLDIPNGVPFGPAEKHTLTWNVALNADELLGLLGTFSWVILMSDDSRERLFDAAGRVLADSGIEGEMTVDVGYRCDVWRARRD